MFFKVKKTTKLSKMMEAYAKRRGVPVSSLRFSLDGERIGVEDTPKMLELEENDQIDVMLEVMPYHILLVNMTHLLILRKHAHLHHR